MFYSLNVCVCMERGDLIKYDLVREFSWFVWLEKDGSVFQEEWDCRELREFITYKL